MAWEDFKQPKAFLMGFTCLFFSQNKVATVRAARIKGMIRNCNALY